MSDIQTIMSGVDVVPLYLAIERQPELWNQNRLRTDYEGSPHADVSDIWIRYNAGTDLKDMSAEHSSVWHEAYRKLPQIRPIYLMLMARLEGERLGGILITRIPPGGRVLPHADHGWHAEYYEKYAVQIKADDRQSFNFEGQKHVARAGDVYWFNNRQTHWVTNDSDQDRITMIVCIRHGE